MLSAEELLAGSRLTYDVEVPAAVLHPDGGVDADAGGSAGEMVRLRPLTVHDLQLIAGAASADDELLATLMVQRSLVEPAMSVPQVAAAHAGLVQYLLHHVNRVSGISATSDELANAAQAPLARASLALERAFGWTPEQVSELTVGQMLLHLQLLSEAPQG
jgi:hypothetical protein